MGWGDCGKNHKTGEMMGYNHRGVCNHPECSEVINHGLSYVCGNMHEGGENGCGMYFCCNHLNNFHEFYDNNLDITICLQGEQLCEDCCTYLEKEYFDNRFYIEESYIKDHLFHAGWLLCEFCRDSFASQKEYGCFTCNMCRLKNV